MKDFSACIPAILRTLPHRPMTKHYKQHLIFRRSISEGDLMIRGEQYYLVKDDTVIPIPSYITRALLHHDAVTRTFGPYMFWNDFDKTAEAKYLMKMFSHRKLTPQVQQKVAKILDLYKPWIDWDREFIQALEEREHDLDITQPWIEEQYSPQMIAEADCDGDISKCGGACYGNKG